MFFITPEMCSSVVFGGIKGAGYPVSKKKMCDLRLRVMLMFATCILATLIGRMNHQNIVQPFMMTRFKLLIQDW